MKLRDIKYLFPLFIAILSVLPVNAQVSIHGKVTDMEEKPLEFATVRIAGTAIGTTTGLMVHTACQLRRKIL